MEESQGSQEGLDGDTNWDRTGTQGRDRTTSVPELPTIG